MEIKKMCIRDRSNVMTPVAKKLSIKLGAIDMPKKRGMHNKPMPRMGGIAIVVGFMATVLLLYNFVEYSDCLLYTSRCV